MKLEWSNLIIKCNIVGYIGNKVAELRVTFCFLCKSFYNTSVLLGHVFNIRCILVGYMEQLKFTRTRI